MRMLIACAVLACCAPPARPALQAAKGGGGGADAAAKKRYVGLRYEASLPAGHRELSAWIIPQQGATPAPADGYGVSVVARGRTTLVWFERVARPGGRRARREVIDAVVAPAFDRNKSLVAFPCYAGDDFDPELLALVEHDGQEFFTRVRRVWRANRRTGRLEDVPVQGIKCQNEGYTS